MGTTVKVTKRAVHLNVGWRFLVWDAVSGDDVAGLEHDGYATRELAIEAATNAGHDVVNEPISASESSVIAGLVAARGDISTTDALRAIGMAHRKIGYRSEHYDVATGKVRHVGNLLSVNAWLGIADEAVAS